MILCSKMKCCKYSKPSRTQWNISLEAMQMSRKAKGKCLWSSQGWPAIFTQCTFEAFIKQSSNRRIQNLNSKITKLACTHTQDNILNQSTLTYIFLQLCTYFYNSVYIYSIQNWIFFLSKIHQYTTESPYFNMYIKINILTHRFLCVLMIFPIFFQVSTGWRNDGLTLLIGFQRNNSHTDQQDKGNLSSFKTTSIRSTTKHLQTTFNKSTFCAVINQHF